VIRRQQVDKVDDATSRPERKASMATVYLVRHGEADYTPIRARRWPGAAADLAPLTRLGVEQAGTAARRLAAVSADRIVSSPMTRALQTAAVIGSHLGLVTEVEFDLREWLPDDTFSWRDHAEVLAAAEDFERCGGEWPAGQRRAWEPLSQVRDRAAAALARQLPPTADGQVLIAVCHGMVIRALTGEARTSPGMIRRISFPGSP
jgi:broad specificity phosphatase PhoE